MTWTNIPSADLDPESPVTTSLVTALANNPAAIANGDTGAPKVQTAALEQTASSEAVTTATIRDGAVTNAKLANNSVDSNKIASSAVSSTQLAANSVIASKIPDDSIDLSVKGKCNATEGVTTIPAGSYVSFTQGLYMISLDGTNLCTIKILRAGSYYGICRQSVTGEKEGAMVWSDGTTITPNLRVYNDDTVSHDIQWQKMT